MSYCSHCGAEVNDEAVVCVRCGCALKPLCVRDESKNDLLKGICYRDFLVDKEIARYLRLRSIVRYTL